jgi:hypothetical protein
MFLSLYCSRSDGLWQPTLDVFWISESNVDRWVEQLKRSTPSEKSAWTVNRGAEVNLELINLGNLEHNWAVVEMGQEVPIPYTGGED